MWKVKAWIAVGIGMIAVSIGFWVASVILYETLHYFTLAICGFIFFIASILPFIIAMGVEKGEISVARQKEKNALKVNFEEKKRLLKASPHYKLIEGYVATRGFGDVQSRRNLRELLNQKGFEFDETEADDLVDLEIIHQEYRDFKKNITYNHPTEFKQYIYNYCNLYEVKYHYHYIKDIKKVLIEDNIDFDEHSLMENIQSCKKQVELERFEKTLLHSENHYSIDDLDMLSGQEFESFLKGLFEQMGYSVEQTKLSGDQGADLILSKFGSKVVVQAKRYANKVTNKAIQEVVASIKHYGAERGMVVTTSEFTAPATELAKSNKIELVDRYGLEKLMQKYL